MSIHSKLRRQFSDSVYFDTCVSVAQIQAKLDKVLRQVDSDQILPLVGELQFEAERWFPAEAASRPARPRRFAVIGHLWPPSEIKPHGLRKNDDDQLKIRLWADSAVEWFRLVFDDRLLALFHLNPDLDSQLWCLSRAEADFDPSLKEGAPVTGRSYVSWIASCRRHIRTRLGLPLPKVGWTHPKPGGHHPKPDYRLIACVRNVPERWAANFDAPPEPGADTAKWRHCLEWDVAVLDMLLRRLSLKRHNLPLPILSPWAIQLESAWPLFEVDLKRAIPELGLGQPVAVGEGLRLQGTSVFRLLDGRLLRVRGNSWRLDQPSAKPQGQGLLALIAHLMNLADRMDLAEELVRQRLGDQVAEKAANFQMLRQVVSRQAPSRPPLAPPRPKNEPSLWPAAARRLAQERGVDADFLELLAVVGSVGCDANGRLFFPDANGFGSLTLSCGSKPGEDVWCRSSSRPWHWRLPGTAGKTIVTDTPVDAMIAKQLHPLNPVEARRPRILSRRWRKLLKSM
ncbi:MAG: hypothetical protein LBU12_07490 [Deltaproteobacteria bacterium]|jgi:hypothetical protein|nr:hypothetical protein [Deltaproteobacteria bacterium]